MSVIGNKGRGRGFTDSHDVPLRRPGQLDTSKFHDLINFIENLCVKDIISGNKLDEMVQLLENSSKTNLLKDIFDDLHKQALEDRQFGVKLAIVCSNPKIYMLNNCNLRFILLQRLQNDYEEREEIRKRSVLNFRNAISLLGGIYCNLKLNGKPMDILASPLLHYLELLLNTSEEEDIELVTIQVYMNGSKIMEQSSSRTEDFLVLVRQILVHRNLSAKSRAMLLFIIDLSKQHFTPILGNLNDFYFSKVDGDPLIDIENYIDIVDGTKSNSVSEFQHFDKFENKTDQSEVKNNLSSITSEVSQEWVELEFGTNEKSSININSEKLSIPRAIRGAGAGDNTKDKNNKKSPRGRRDKVPDHQIWSLKQNTSSRVWGHDDRFEKDYTEN